MHFYRSLNAIKAITFDLDDTLYDNSMVVEKAEQQLICCLNQYPPLHQLTLDEFHHQKNSVSLAQPDIYHDVIAWRLETIRTILYLYAFPASQIDRIADEAMSLFTLWRHKIDVPSMTHQVLTKLAENYPLAAVTNGNVDINLIGLGDYFQFSLRGGADGRSKPFCDLFNTAAKKLAIPASHILHVGDNLLADINGAIESGFQSCWIRDEKQHLFEMADARSLPHIEITKLSELNNLL